MASQKNSSERYIKLIDNKIKGFIEMETLSVWYHFYSSWYCGYSMYTYNDVMDEKVMYMKGIF